MAKSIEDAESKMPNSISHFANLERSIERHDQHIANLNGRIGHVEKTLDGHSAILIDIKTAVTRQEAAPRVDIHKFITSTVSLAVLGSMMCAGIIYIASNISAPLNVEVKQILNQHDREIADLKRERQWNRVEITSTKK